MPRKYIRRTLETVLRRAAAQFPVVVVTGPRQAGKTTLLRNLFGRTHGYVALDLPDVQAAAQADPRGFLDACPVPVIFDEVHGAPELLSYIRERVDARRDQPGQYVLTGSQNLLLAQRITETLAGRAAILRLLPLAHREAAARPHAPLPWEEPHKARPQAPRLAGDLWNRFLRGGYPELVVHPRRDRNLWHASYLRTYLERDVRALRQVGDLVQFQMFVRALAARSAQLLDLTGLARDLGLAVNTVKAWLSVLEASYQIFTLRPYFANMGKRLVKTPKVYFTDVGMLCHLVGLRDTEHAARGPMAGAIFETAVLSEIVRTLLHRGEEPQIHFWRTSAGREVDVIIESAGRLVPVEVKLSATPKPAMADGIRAFQEALGERAAPGYVIHSGDHQMSLGPNVLAWPIAAL